ncbi:hypothetical protein PR048_016838 [Dryococelus australis]|uniref:Uncharacterized protein n=1 Tax=Dryococelus australis TaxID=614101 RepID=A0ABQ9H7T4_9NEOP|nr:hypothetical protein PR048_016838 [Dryococelus australis]
MQKFTVLTAKKIVERSPVKYKMVKAASCLDPRKLFKIREECRASMDTCLQVLMSAEHLTALQSDRTSAQFTKFVTVVNSDTLAAFHVQNDRSDTFYAGFFVWGRSDMLLENLHEGSLIGLRRV